MKRLVQRLTQAARGAWAIAIVCASACTTSVVEGVACADDADCRQGARCVEYSCVAGNPASGPVVLDDFSLSSGVAADARFSSWSSGISTADNCEEGYDGQIDLQFADGMLRFEWEVFDLLDGKDCFPGSAVVLRPLAPSVDLSMHQTVTLEYRSAPGVSQCLGSETFYLSFLCEPTLFELTFPGSSDWRTVTLSLAELAQPSWALEPDVSLRDCMLRVENVALATDTPPLDGQCQAGELIVDSIVWDANGS